MAPIRRGTYRGVTCRASRARRTDHTKGREAEEQEKESKKGEALEALEEEQSQQRAASPQMTAGAEAGPGGECFEKPLETSSEEESWPRQPLGLVETPAPWELEETQGLETAAVAERFTSIQRTSCSRTTATD